jgi:hypothetical protein
MGIEAGSIQAEKVTPEDIVTEVTRVFEASLKFNRLVARKETAIERVRELLSSRGNDVIYEAVSDVPVDLVDALSLASLEAFLAEDAYSRYADKAGRYYSKTNHMGTHVAVRARPGSGHIKVMGLDSTIGDTDFGVKSTPDEVEGFIQISKKGNQGIIELRQGDSNYPYQFVDVELLDEDGNLQVELTVL